VFDRFISSGVVAAFLAFLAWMAVMTRLDLSYAYPFMSSNVVVVLLLSEWGLNEPITLQEGPRVGLILIVLGTVVAARG
jgi:drug/metabolite transporter (DMT)-like permease